MGVLGLKRRLYFIGRLPCGISNERNGGETIAPPGLAYRALVALKSPESGAANSRLKLTPGMQVAAEIHLGQRSVIEYLLSPIQKVAQEAARER